MFRSLELIFMCGGKLLEVLARNGRDLTFVFTASL